MSPPDPARFRAAMAMLPTGVTVPGTQSGHNQPIKNLRITFWGVQGSCPIFPTNREKAAFPLWVSSPSVGFYNELDDITPAEGDTAEGDAAADDGAELAAAETADTEEPDAESADDDGAEDEPTA